MSLSFRLGNQYKVLTEMVTERIAISHKILCIKSVINIITFIDAFYNFFFFVKKNTDFFSQ